MAEETHTEDRPVPWAAVFATAAGMLALLNLYQAFAGPAASRAAETAQVRAELTQLKEATMEDRRRFAEDINALRRDANTAQDIAQKALVDIAEVRGDLKAMGRK